MMKERTCRVCGCSQSNACFDKKRGHGCHWVSKTLCNVCDDKANAIKLTSSMVASLAYLITGRATARRRAVYVDGGLPHRGALANRDAICSEYVSTRRRTIYWVSPLGLELVRRWRATR